MSKNNSGGRRKRYLRRITKALEGKHAKKVILNISLTGSAADTWSTLQEASDGLPIDDQGLRVLNLMRSGRKVRAELRALEREGQP